MGEMTGFGRATMHVAQKLMIESGCADELRGIANVTAMRRAA